MPHSNRERRARSRASGEPHPRQYAGLHPRRSWDGPRGMPMDAGCFDEHSKHSRRSRRDRRRPVHAAAGRLRHGRPKDRRSWRVCICVRRARWDSTGPIGQGPGTLSGPLSKGEVTASSSARSCDDVASIPWPRPSRRATRTTLQRPPAEVTYADELAPARAATPRRGRRGWRLTPRVGRPLRPRRRGQRLAPKFVGSRAFAGALRRRARHQPRPDADRRARHRQVLLSASCSPRPSAATRRSTIQGSAGTTEDNIKYSWNYALLLAEGPTSARSCRRRSTAG